MYPIFFETCQCVLLHVALTRLYRIPRPHSPSPFPIPRPHSPFLVPQKSVRDWSGILWERDLGAGTGFGSGNFGAGGSEQRYSGKPDGVAGTPKSFFLCQIKSAFKHIFSLFFFKKRINTIFVF